MVTVCGPGPPRGGEDQGKAPGEDPGQGARRRPGRPRNDPGGLEGGPDARWRRPGHLGARARSPGMRQPPRLADAAADAPAVAGTGGLLPSL